MVRCNLRAKSLMQMYELAPSELVVLIISTLCIFPRKKNDIKFTQVEKLL